MAKKKKPWPIKIAPYEYTVKHQRGFAQSSGADGATMESDELIILDNDIQGNYEKEVLLHEAMHAMWGQTSLDRDYPDGPPDSEGEKIIFTLAPRILALLRDNPELVKWLTEK